MLREENYWLTTVRPIAVEEHPLPPSVDAAIIGGGYTGLSAARRLAQAGLNVAVLEANTAGWGASSRNGGMVLTGLKLGVETLLKRYGLEMSQRLFNFSLAAIDTVEEIVMQEKIDCSFSRTGCLEVAWKPSHFDGYARAAEQQEKFFSHKSRVLTRQELPAEIGSDLYHGGLLEEISAGINPGQYVLGLAQAAHHAGAVIHENTRVMSLERNGNGYTLNTKRGSLRATKVFAATNGYTTDATPWLNRRSIPVGSYIIATAPLPEGLARQVIPNNRMIFDSKHYLYYFRLTPDRRMLFGGRAAFFPESGNAVRQSAEILRQGMLQVFPQLAGIPVEYCWGGTLSFTFDMMPHAGEKDGLHYAMGYAGHGVAFSTHLGRLVAEKMLDLPVENPIAELPFPGAPLGLYSGFPWFLPFAGAWHKILDWVA